jgi:MSHA biogenesis protein MshK
MKRFVFILLASAAGAVAAQSLPDPTRPPGAAHGAPGGPVQGGNPLQSVIIPARGKPSAVINGEQVQVGGKVGEAQVVRITEAEVVLKGPEGVQTLRMTPDVEKRPAASATTGKRDRKESGPARQGVQWRIP